MKKLSKKEFEDLKTEIGNGHAIKEISGVYEAVLHLKNVVNYMKTDEAKKHLSEQLGEHVYLEQLRLQEKSLQTREMELEFLEGLLVNDK